jgi:AraC-like DNA-binding protein
MTVRAFASAGLLGLVLEGLARQGLPAPMPSGPALAHRLGGAAVPLDAKRGLLQAILAAHGPVALLRLGEALRGTGFHPLLHTLLRARGGGDVLRRWQRLERYAHSHHRTVLEAEAPGGEAARAWQVRHVAIGAAGAPAPAEDLLILGMQAGLLAAIGCAGIEAAMDGRPLLAEGRWEADAAKAAIDRQATGAWQLRWAAEPDPPGAAPAEPLPFATLPPAERLAALLAEDPARGWSLAAAAKALGFSARSLQRRLAEGGASFIAVQRAVQLRAACAALSDPDPPPLPAIGFACGFSDQAHFTREFARRTGVPPGRYRALLRGNPWGG